VTSLVDQIRAASVAESLNERLRRRQQAIALILKTFGWTLFIALALMAGAAALGWLTWKFALVCGGVLLVVYVVVALALFLVAQRDMFAEMNSRKSALNQLETMQTNLHSALEDLSRLSMAYGQLLSWCRAVGAFLRAPFGAVPPVAGVRAQLIQGLPRSTLVAVAAPGSDNGDTAVHRIQQRLYRLGWLTRPWEQLLTRTAADVRAEPTDVLAMPGAGSRSALDRWSSELATGEVSPSGADVLWRRVQQMFDDPAVGIGEGLIDTLVLADGRRVPAAEFGDGMTERRNGRAAPFDASLFTHAAQTASSSMVAIDEGMVARCGLGYRAAVIQAGEGLPAYDFAVFSPQQQVSAVDNEVPPGSGDLVF
jgi:ABC-type multidrug transport system fused ATPase/permease subunit